MAKARMPRTKPVAHSTALELSKEEILRDYRIGWESRHASLLGRKEVLTGKAKFGIFGDGKEVPQLAMARYFANGDFRAGYYRDQTFMFARGMSSLREFFSQLYANTDAAAEPASAGRSMNGHFGTRLLNEDGTWKNLTEMPNSSSDISPTGSQMPRLVGLAYASRLYREVQELHSHTTFSVNGNEVAWGTIGNASAAEGMFWEAVDAIGVLKAPAIVSIWDDGYGISVPNEVQHTKGNVGELLEGFRRTEGSTSGYEKYTVAGWDYLALLQTYKAASAKARAEHVPAIVHVVEVTQPQGHSTSGSHERYKSKERLAWETEYDCLVKMRAWIITEKIATAKELAAIEAEAEKAALEAKQEAWDAYMNPIRTELAEAVSLIENLAAASAHADALRATARSLAACREPFRRDIFEAIHKALRLTRTEPGSARTALTAWRDKHHALQTERYSSYLHAERSHESALAVPEVPPAFSPSSPSINGFEVLNACFDAALARDPRVLAFGEDLGFLGDVNQAFSGLQAKYGALRVSDTGIREVTILGQAIGLAMRGLRPIAEMQYLDYILYALQLMSDDLATVQWRTKGGQRAPVIVRTRGHRLEGVWHSGSPMAGIINLVRGIHVCVPRNMTQAVGMYNTLLKAEEPGLVVEVLNGYRLKEQKPDNIGEFTIPLGVPEILREGSDVTLVTYGATCRPAMAAATMLEEVGISVEIIDVRTLLPFDLHHAIAKSLEKTNRVIFVDEDVPGGTTAYMMQHVLEKQNGWRLLDSKPSTLTAQPHRPAYGTDGNYWSKPEAEHIFDAVYAMMHEVTPSRWPDVF